MNQASRRDFLVLGSVFGWLPFFKPKHISLAGARFRILRNGRAQHHYLFIHGNEETAREVLVQHIQAHEGVAFVVESHTRNVPIETGQIDPNRMFSRAGAQLSLKDLNPDWTEDQLQAALLLLDRGRPKLLEALLPPRGGRLVALHNNSEAYSVENEEPGSDAASIRDRDNPHAFFLCTNPEDFQILLTSPYNVVLQQASQPDDGSLSRLSAARNLRYVNLEVSLGRRDRQEDMLAWLEWHLP